MSRVLSEIDHRPQWARICCILVVFAIGCNSQSGETSSATVPPPSPFVPSIETALPHCARGYNKLTGLMRRTIEEYDREVGDLKGIPENRPNMLSLSAGDKQEFEEAASSFAAGKNVTPSDRSNLARKAEKAVMTARAVLKDYDDAALYFAAEKYKDDQGKRGLEIHAAMTSDTKSYLEALHTLDRALKTLENEQLTLDFQRHGDPTTYGHQFRAFNMAARAFMDATGSPEAAAKAEAAVEEAFQKVKAFADGKGSKLHPVFGGYMHQVNNFYTQSIVVERGLREKTDPHG